VQYQTRERAPTTIRVARMLLQESGTYNPMYTRPYQTHLAPDVLDNVLRRVDQAGSGGISGATLAGVASSMVAPSATPTGEISIPMGWSDRRIRFLMEVHVTVATGAEMIYYFQGYTSHLGVDAHGNIDPQMQFIINSYMRVNRAMRYNSYSQAVMQDVVTESAHIVDGMLVNQTMGGEIFCMRPNDLFAGIQSAYIESAYQNFSGNTLRDTRYRMSNESMRSNRSNNIAGNYLASVVDTYKNAQQLAEFGQGTQDIYARSQSMSVEASPYENPFIRAISNARGQNCVTSFDIAVLRRIDPNVENVTNYLRMGHTELAQVHQAGQTAFWSGSDATTLAATILSNGVPAVMMDLMISKIFFRSTNNDAGGKVSTIIIDGKSLTSLDMSQNFELFKVRLEKEILFDLTYGNQVLYQLEMSVDLFGETRITIQLDNDSAVTYTTPSFCDSLLTPIITNNRQNFEGVTNDFETLMNSLNIDKTMAINTMV